MSAASRQSKQPRKGANDSSRRAWGAGARASPTFSPSNNSSRSANPSAPTPSNSQSFPPLGQANGARPENNANSTVLPQLSGLTGTTITLTTKGAKRYEGVISSTTGEGDTPGVTLKDVKDLGVPGAPLKDQLFIAASTIDTWSSGPADAKLTSSTTNGDSFGTDTDISHKKPIPRERELQAWQPAEGILPPAPLGGAQGDDLTFGPGASSGGWDQFAVNEKLFGVKTDFNEDLYTTKLDRSGADFKERERKAQRIANEIIGATTNNPHIAEERNQAFDDSSVNEEDKYGAVVRGANAYVPPGARKAAAAAVANVTGTTAMSTAPAAPSKPEAKSETKTEVKTDAPKVAVNGAEAGASSVAAPAHSSSTSKAPSPVPSASVNKAPADALPAFRDFVTIEKQRLNQKRQALVKTEMDKRMAELVKFSQNFKLNKPIPEDLVSILAKDEDKQRAIREKATKDAQSAGARSIGPVTTSAPGLRAHPQAKVETARKIGAAAPSAAAKTTTASNAAATPTSTTAPKVGIAAKPSTGSDAPKKPISMYIQPIPPFKGQKRQPSINTTAASTHGLSTTTNTTNGTTTASTSNNAQPLSPHLSSNRLNVNASSFRPNPKANAFTPGAPSSSTSNQSVTSASASPKAKPETAPVPSTNLFFGPRPIKKTTVHLKDEFNPFKSGKVPEPATVSAIWPFTGKRHTQMHPLPQHQPQQHSPHMGPPVPPAMPPPPYEEDPAARPGYVYAYPPYAYPSQMYPPMMAPPGPPTGYIPTPFMQPMPYPPGMPPPNAIYAAPAMGQLPPPGTYMPPPPPPGAYPPPPNGAGPRPSMPPTPIPAHAHPYYHQSPQMPHAVPYPMMMPPPPPPQSVPPHPYEGGPAPPVQMGGHA
ncbi:hypothetical protein AX16_002633 [Volvariella volvacea WC 439]|nr:hypothetical protein AX16_002633 [Volvariella volvacea WC 439]